MGFFLTDFIQSAFTPAGTNARRDQTDRQADIASIGGQLATQGGNRAIKANQFAAGFDSKLETAIRQMAQGLNGSNARENAIRQGNALQARAMSQSIPLQLQQNPELARAYRMQMQNQAQGQSNQAYLDSLSPERRQQALMALIQILNQYQQQAGTGLSQGAGLVYGQPTVQVQGGLMDMLAPALGQWFGQQVQGGQ